MILSDGDIAREVTAGTLGIDPFEPAQVQPASYDVRLGREFRVFRRGAHAHIDTQVIPDDLTVLVHVAVLGSIIIHPGELMLAATMETFKFPDHLAGRLEGKSSLGRIGLLPHAAAGFFDPGFRGTGTLEMINASGLPIKLYPGMLIGQMQFLLMYTRPQRPYGHPELKSHYQDQAEPTASRYEAK